jgi:cytochrome c551/c552
VSHYIDTPHASYGDSAGLSNRQRWEIFAGIVVAIALGIAAIAFVNRVDSPVVEPAVQAVAQSYAGVDDLATRPAVPAQSFAGSDDLATRAAVPAQSFAGSDDLATRVAVVPAQSYAGSDDLATRPIGPRNAGSDDLATR